MLEEQEQAGFSSDEEESLLNDVRRECNRIENNNGSNGSNGSNGANNNNSANEDNQLFQNIMQCLLESSDLEEVLINLLGFDEFDLIAKIISNKDVLIDEFNKKIKSPLSQDDGKFKFMTEAERNIQVRENARLAKTQTLDSYKSKTIYPHVFKSDDAGGNMISVTGKKYSLPKDSQRYSFDTHEEFIIPYTKKSQSKLKKEKIVYIKDLDFLCQGTFKDYKSLNRIQALLYPVAYNTNENMLVCAPTGAGKTDVALLTILHTINQFVSQTESEDGIQVDINYSEFKIVYVAPLKALAAEIVEKFSKKLQWLGIQVRELTGDMQLTKAEIVRTQVIVTTPEKWDVVTRKSNGDTELVEKLKLLIIDEVHLLHEDRGSVIETLVARTLRQVESTQSMIRILGLSATLPNFMDVADFLGVNRQVGMFYFDSSFRPVPLRQEILGIKGKSGSKEAREKIDRVSYEKLISKLEEGHQVMVFVHSRKDTINTSKTFIKFSRNFNDSDLFDCTESPSYEQFSREMSKNKNKDMRELFISGFGVHHAGMPRSDRRLTEKMFLSGAIKVLCCTATLAWGVNLPAAVVIIKGTQVYDSKRGGFVDLGISDIIQIFGRAGRPQFTTLGADSSYSKKPRISNDTQEVFGTGILCTTGDRLDHYISLLTQQHPIESKFSEKIVDNLNAEISLGTVTNVDEGVAWLGYTYLNVRMRQNPFAYAIDWKELAEDPQLVQRRREMIISAARRLHYLQMIVFDERTMSFIAKDLGRIASDFYLLNDSVEIFNQLIKPTASEADVLSIISTSAEFDSIKFREEESQELMQLLEKAVCQIGGTPDSAQGKTNILLQAYVSQDNIKDSALASDAAYVAQNSARICRALFLVGLNRRWGVFTKIMLTICKSIDKRMWSLSHPIHQFELPQQIMRNIESKNPSMDILRGMDAGELGELVHNVRMGKVLYRLIGRFPTVLLNAEIFPITLNVMRVHVELEPDFVWDEKYHGVVQFFWILVEESNKSTILHFEKYILNKRSMKGVHEMDFMISLSDPLPPQIIVRCISDTWIGSETVHSISFQHLIKPHNENLQTKLLKLQPLPITALHSPEIEKIYSQRFKYFNPMQTMTFHSLYNTNSSVFVGSPTGSGKTVVAELAIWHAFREFPGSKVVYIAPMKALVRERVDDWTRTIVANTNYKLVELTGDSLPDSKDVRNADIIITTPEKFDGISRNWQTRVFVQKVSLVIMDEIHLLASDRGPILEMIVSRMNYISSQTKKPVRLLGMSTAVANAMDMAGWLGVKEGLFNFPQSVRPVPLQMYIDGFPDNLAFCPLMKTMNKPSFMAIKKHSPTKPVLIFVASRRQTRLTALDIIHLCGMEENPRRFLKIEEDELDIVLRSVKDETLRLSLQFGIGLHHAGLTESDRQISHKLFESSKIQILIATSTLAWGVNLPAHLVIVKGTQYFDAKIEAYRDMDLTDILQMLGRSGRPKFDTYGVAMVFTKESKKMFYKHFLNVGFPVESSLHKVLDNHIGAEISAGTIKTRQDAMDFLTCTFLYRRAHNNPTYYGIEDQSNFGVSQFLTKLIDDAVRNLEESNCVLIGEDNLKATPFLHISSYYYLSHKTVRIFINNITRNATFRDCLKLLCQATEYDELATRHGEELINIEMSQEMRYPAEDLQCEFYWDPHVKAYLLLQAYMSRVDLPIADYAQDTVSVLDQSLRILQAYIDCAAEMGYLSVVLILVKVMICIKQGVWFDDDPITSLPGFTPQRVPGYTLDGQQDIRAVKEHNKASPQISLDQLGKLNYRELEQFANENNIRGENRKNFLKVASHIPSGKVIIKQKNDPSNLNIEIMHDNKALNSDFKIYCSKFLKAQRETWFIIMCDPSIDELYVIKRASPRMLGKGSQNNNSNNVVVSCKIDVPEELYGRKLKIMCVNDGMDIIYEVDHVLESK
ncbi:hypothetical protein PACTADRAFT_44149 [Pachysolen tannophilus NRRL Y-2460]|uniref:RNA helicase n=1 Tax=Pachysolen tannophilus NRRL Y-2460 TaxID=669874 RepID=A0A1E4TTL0_PACTA|nr:hypothetical protein PACTADRAFT_44149 [Pachysolen tannophilus NRRL Y-2460]